VTSRPFASTLLHDVADQRVNIIGFHQSSRKKYAAEALKTFPSIFENFQRYLKHNPNIDALCYNPSVMSICVYINQKISQPLHPKYMKIHYTHHMQIPKKSKYGTKRHSN